MDAYLLIIFVAVVACVGAFFVYKKRPVAEKKPSDLDGLSPDALQLRKLKAEVARIENESNNRGFEPFFKKYTGPIILVLGFSGAVLAYVTQIKSYVNNINKKEVAQYTEIQIQAIEKLGQRDEWTQKAGIRVLEKMGVDAIDILLDRLNSLPADKDSLAANILTAVNKIYKSVWINGSESQLEDFYDQIRKSNEEVAGNYGKHNPNEVPSFRNNLKMINSLAEESQTIAEESHSQNDEIIKELNNRLFEYVEKIANDDPNKDDFFKLIKKR